VNNAKLRAAIYPLSKKIALTMKSETQINRGKK